jgi:hypothetical protein
MNNWQYRSVFAEFSMMAWLLLDAKLCPEAWFFPV